MSNRFITYHISIACVRLKRGTGGTYIAIGSSYLTSRDAIIKMSVFPAEKEAMKSSDGGKLYTDCDRYESPNFPGQPPWVFGTTRRTRDC